MTEARAATLIYKYLTCHLNGAELATPLVKQYPKAAELVIPFAAQYIAERETLMHAKIIHREPPPPPPAQPAQQNDNQQQPERRRQVVVREVRDRQGNAVLEAFEQHPDQQRPPLIISSLEYKGVIKIMAVIGCIWGFIAAAICIYALLLVFIVGEVPAGDLLGPVFEKMNESMNMMGITWQDIQKMDRVIVSRVIGFTSGVCFIVSPILYAAVFAALGGLVVLVINGLLRLAGGLRIHMR